MMDVTNDTLVLAAATLAAAMVSADIAADRLHLDSEGSPAWVMQRFETALENLQEQIADDEDDLDAAIRAPKGSIFLSDSTV